MENRSSPCVFVGYSLTQSAYLCLEPISGRLYISRHVKFVENSYPFRTSTPSPSLSSESEIIKNSLPSNPDILTVPHRLLVSAHPPSYAQESLPLSSAPHRPMPPPPALSLVHSSIPTAPIARGDQMNVERSSAALLT